MNPRIFPDPPFQSQILIYQGLYEWTGRDWRCVEGCEMRRSVLGGVNWPREEARYDYPEIGRFPQPFFWCGRWFLGTDGNWHLAQSWSNYLADFY